MFWIGMIVGIVFCVTVLFGMYLYVTRVRFKSPDEYWDTIGAIYDCTANRESELQVLHNDQLLNVVVFEEK